MRRIYMYGLLVITLCSISSLSYSANRETYRILPGSIALSHQGATHRLVVEQFDGDMAIADRTAQAEFQSSNTSVVTVDESGKAVAAGNGKTTITASIDGKLISIDVVVSGCDSQYQWSFTNDIQPALTKIGCNAGACHGAAAGKHGLNLSLRGYDQNADYNAFTRHANGRRVLLGKPEDSLMLLKPSGSVRHGGGRLIRKDSLEYRMLLEWIEQGTPPPSNDDVHVARIEVLPSLLQLKQGEEQQMLVLAHYDDGTTRDVTHWCKFHSTDDGVAGIDSEGLAKMYGSGSAALTVWFSSNVAFSTVTVPYPDPQDAAVFTNAQRNNFIDDKILDQLRALNIPPSGPSDDLVFVRRAYLDAIGVLPTKDEIMRFMFDPDSNKRAKLIDRLLERPEYVDLWTYKWSDLLLVSSKKLPNENAKWAFYRYIRDSVKDNKGWNTFVKEIVTAQGSNLENGAGNYFLIHQENTDLIETTSQAFLGMSVTCARCHNHPLEKWTQDQYYQFANLFAQVQLKNGDRSGETYVMSTGFGNVLHPLKGKPLQPAPLDGEPLPWNSHKDRREHLSEWLTSPDNPYFARAIVNRVWKHFMGKGLVEPEDDLRLTNPPVNEPLFAALEKDFVEHSFDVKYLIRTIMNSAAYQRSSSPVGVNQNDANHFSHYYIRRMPAEVLLDAYSYAVNVPTVFPGYPKGWRAMQLPDSRVASYFLDTFGRPERVITCACERQETPTLTQTLHISNGETLNQKLKAKGNIIGDYLDDGLPLRDILIDVYLRLLSRAPSQDELEHLLTMIGEERDWAMMERPQQRELLEDILWAILSGKEFMFIR